MAVKENRLDSQRIKRILDEADKKSAIVIDTETTGLKPGYDEVLQLSIVDLQGNVIFNELIKPQRRKTWKAAQEIHGISPNDVKDKNELPFYQDRLTEIFDNADTVIGYNLDFDLDMIRENGVEIHNNGYFDMMAEFSDAHGAWSYTYDRPQYVKLTDCARFYGYKYKAHDALADAQATAHCFLKFVDECKNLLNDKLTEEDNARREKLAKIEQEKNELKREFNAQIDSDIEALHKSSKDTYTLLGISAGILSFVYLVARINNDLFGIIAKIIFPILLIVVLFALPTMIKDIRKCKREINRLENLRQ